MNEQYVVTEVRISSENGEIACLTAFGPFHAKEEATSFMETAYIENLKGRYLENNGAVDEDSGEAIPGGYFTEDEAGIYDYAEFAFGQLLELVSFTVVKLGGGQA